MAITIIAMVKRYDTKIETVVDFPLRPRNQSRYTQRDTRSKDGTEREPKTADEDLSTKSRNWCKGRVTRNPPVDSDPLGEDYTRVGVPTTQPRPTPAPRLRKRSSVKVPSP